MRQSGLSWKENWNRYTFQIEQTISRVCACISEKDAGYGQAAQMSHSGFGEKKNGGKRI